MLFRSLSVYSLQSLIAAAEGVEEAAQHLLSEGKSAAMDNLKYWSKAGAAAASALIATATGCRPADKEANQMLKDASLDARVAVSTCPRLFLLKTPFFWNLYCGSLHNRRPCQCYQSTQQGPEQLCRSARASRCCQGNSTPFSSKSDI